MFDRNRVAQQKETIRKNVKSGEVGTVKKVYEHLGPDDDSNFEADVQIQAGAEIEPKIPVEFGGAIDVPKVGDKVNVKYRDDGRQAYVAGLAYSTSNRPPVARAGVHRREFESGLSPAGEGNLYFSGNTTYADGNPATDDSRELKPASAVLRIAKRKNAIPDPNLERDVPAKVEFFDSTTVNGENKSHISVEINREGAIATDKTWGAKFNMQTGTWKLADPNGFGIVSHGDGTFTWHIKKEEGALNFKEHDSETGPLDL